MTNSLLLMYALVFGYVLTALNYCHVAKSLDPGNLEITQQWNVSYWPQLNISTIYQILPISRARNSSEITLRSFALIDESSTVLSHKIVSGHTLFQANQPANILSCNNPQCLRYQYHFDEGSLDAISGISMQERVEWTG